MASDTQSQIRAVDSKKKRRLIVIDDDELIVAGLRALLPPNWVLIPAFDLETSSQHFESEAAQADAALIDLHLSQNLKQAEGLDRIRALHHFNPQLSLIAMSGDLDRQLMENGLHAGAYYFLGKPIGRDELFLILEKIEALNDLRSPPPSRAVRWVGSSPESDKVLRQVAALKGENGPILIEGESGTGKEVIAHLLHEQDGPRRPLVTVNLAAIPESVFESEFFGHVRGAFTGAEQNKPGLIELATGGDLFLDEVEALSMNNQAKLLRFLETGESRRVGGRETIRAPVRIIAATNRNLGEMVREKEFREDLLWRLQGKRVALPPLRERPDDIAELATHFLDSERPRRTKSLSSDAIEILKGHHWPGNVRELKRCCEQMGLYSPLPILRAEDVRRILPVIAPSPIHATLDLSLGLSELVARFEAQIIRESLRVSNDADRAAELIGISRSSLYKKMKDYGIERGSTSKT